MDTAVGPVKFTSSASGIASVDVHEAAAALPVDVCLLLEEHAGYSLQFSKDWFVNLEATVFGAHSGIRHFVLRRDGQPVAALALLFEGGRMGRNARALGNYYTCLYAPATAEAVDAQELSKLFVAVRQHDGGIGTLTLAPMSVEGPGFALIEQALSLAGFSTARHFCFGNWYLQAPSSWAAYLASREGKLRSTIKRMAQRLETEEGHVEILTARDELERGIEAYGAVYAKSWKVPEPSPEFTPGLIRLCAGRGALRLGLVWLRGKPIAAQLWIVHAKRAEIYKVAYDEEFKAYSPGTVLTARLLAHVLEQDQVTEVDYLIGDDPYKKNWMSHRRERWGLVAYNRSSIIGLLAWSWDMAKRTAKPWIARLKALQARRASGMK